MRGLGKSRGTQVCRAGNSLETQDGRLCSGASSLLHFWASTKTPPLKAGWFLLSYWRRKGINPLPFSQKSEIKKTNKQPFGSWRDSVFRACVALQRAWFPAPISGGLHLHVTLTGDLTCLFWSLGHLHTCKHTLTYTHM